jgi:hypothetical protein
MPSGPRAKRAKQVLTPAQQQILEQRTRLVAIGTRLAVTAVEGYGYCGAGCVLSDRVCRLPCWVGEGLLRPVRTRGR